MRPISIVSKPAPQASRFRLWENRLSDYRAKLQANREALTAGVWNDNGQDLLALHNELFNIIEELLSERQIAESENLLIEEEREQVFLNLEDERNLWQTMVESMLDPVTICDAQGKATYMNKACADLVQMEIHPDVSMDQQADHYGLYHPDGTTLKSHELPLQKAALENITVRDVEILHYSRNGEKHNLIWNATPLYDASGTVIGAMAVGRDITNQREVETAIAKLFEENQQQKELLEDIFAAGPFGIVVISVSDFTVQMANPTYRALSPHPEIDPVGKQIDEVWKPEEGFDIIPVLSNVLQNNNGFRTLNLNKEFPDHLRRIYSFHIQPLHHPEKENLLLVIWDITEIELAREEAEEGRRTLEALMQYIPEGITIADAPEAKVRMISDHGRELIGLSSEEIVNKPRPEWWKIYDPAKGTLAPIDQMPLSRAIWKGETITDEEWLLENARGEMLSILSNAGPIRNRSGEIIGGISAWRDITDRKRAEAALQQSEERYRVLVDAIANMVWRTTPNGENLLDLYGDEELETVVPRKKGNSWISRVHPDDQAYTEEAWRKAIATKSFYDIEHRQLSQDGSYRWLHSRAIPHFNTVGEVIEWIGISTDITDRKKAEQAVQEYSELLEARVKERTEELVNLQRRLVDNVEAERLWVSQELHDGPMQEIYALYYELASLEDIPGDSNWQTEIISLQDRLKQINENLRAVTRELRPASLTPFGLEKAIREHGERIDQEHPELHVKLELIEDGTLLPEHIRLTLFRIYQTALINVIRHAEASEAVVRFTYDEQNAFLEIQDDGKGFVVPKRLRTYARKGHFGLAGAVERAEAIGGKLEVESAPGKGTRLRVTAPLRQEQAASINGSSIVV